MAFKLQEKPPAPQREHQPLRNTDFLNFIFIFWVSFLPSWIRIQRPS